MVVMLCGVRNLEKTSIAEMNIVMPLNVSLSIDASLALLLVCACLSTVTCMVDNWSCYPVNCHLQECLRPGVMDYLTGNIRHSI